MGITKGLVRAVFSKSRSISTQESNARNHVIEKRKWGSVRSYLCGDEIDSVLAQEDLASIRSLEATFSQPKLLDDESTARIETESEVTEEEDESFSTVLSCEHDAAAIVIQSAFRGFLVRRQREAIEPTSNKESSVATSLEVQTGRSIDISTFPEENTIFQHQIQVKARTQAMKLKEDWDASTVSSIISKMRIQNRLEATTRRERALAYAFSQQLRTCSKKKQTKSNETSEKTNLGWSWLERWMATRLPDNSTLVHDQICKQVTSNQTWLYGTKHLDISMEGKESCGSNEVPAQINSFHVPIVKKTSSYKPAKNKLGASKTMSRRLTVKNAIKQDIGCIMQKGKKAGNKREIKDVSSNAMQDLTQPT